MKTTETLPETQSPPRRRVRFGSDGNGLFVATFDGGAWHLFTRAEEIDVVPAGSPYDLEAVRGYLRGEGGILEMY